MLFPLLLSLSLTVTSCAAVTVYGQIPLAQTSTGSAGPEPTAVLLHAYDETILIPPTLPAERAPTKFTLNLSANNASVDNLSILQPGSFYGFSIEMSVITQVLGKNSSHLQVPFLNLMANIQQRAGGVRIRLGGNTQDFAVLVDSIANGHSLDKQKSDNNNPTLTPAVLYTLDLFHMAANISSLVNVRWYLGIPFNDTNWRLDIAEHGQAILGDKLLGLQAGNEPDYYAAHGHRPQEYSPMDYFNEFSSLVKAIEDNPRIPNKNMLIGPSLASGPWEPQLVWDTNYIPTFSKNLHAITMEHYPSNNCFETFHVGTRVDPQETFPQFLNHNSGLNLVRPYLQSSALAQAAGKPFIMFETNTATCGGLPGISNSFGAALWALDYGLTMAASNFSGALLHVGGQNVYYNPFTAPPTNTTAFNQWTVGSIYYSVLIVAEAFGQTNTSQIVDTSNNGIFTPSYAIYEQGALSKVALFNFNDDPTGGSDITATITVGGGNVPASVKVKYFAASSVSVQTNLTWAGQTLGNKFKVDGQLRGALDIVTINCDQAANACLVPVKAPGFALVFLTDSPATQDPTAVTFATTAFTKTINTITVDPSVIANSNGITGKERSKMGSTSPGSVTNDTNLTALLPSVYLLLSSLFGGALAMVAFWAW
ncbi:glycoside hydrolase family 79 protein [Collybia nuda]|uniref:Glycoside hydrolase family 79 protein n=1 Tax=Collybia nuda TaxID=64659 RepID=A0A9P5XTI9_9AGAR|nr:glycoside hydrolase family 79 protein [Collybia nuda]